MKLIIDIPEETKQAFDRANNDDINFCFYDYNSVVGKAIKNGIVLPDNPTNGDVIKMMFPTVDISTNGMFGKEGTVFVHHKDHIIIFDLDWWNAPYREDGEPE